MLTEWFLIVAIYADSGAVAYIARPAATLTECRIMKVEELKRRHKREAECFRKEGK